jgi:hypothetical protein
VRGWATTFAKEVWPEWTLKGLGPDHPMFLDPNPLKQRPEILGLDDGERVFLVYAMDDISCAWQTKALSSREYLFKWAVNLFTYATDHSATRFKFQDRQEPPALNTYTAAVKAAKTDLAMVRVKYGTGPGWLSNRNYKTADLLAKALQKRAAINIKLDDAGVAPADLGKADIAYLIGAGTEVPTAAERDALKAFAAKGGFLWVEAAGGSTAWDTAFRKMASEMKWDLKDMATDSPLLTGKFATATGYSLTRGVMFRHALRAQRLGPAARADAVGIYQDGKLVGVYSPMDTLFCMTDYDAGNIRGYRKNDAEAVATNIALLAGDKRE